jgi:hypothetical protein
MATLDVIMVVMDGNRLMNDRLPPPYGWQMIMADFYKQHPDCEADELAPPDDQIKAIIAREGKAPSQLPYGAMSAKQRVEQRQRIAQRMSPIPYYTTLHIHAHAHNDYHMPMM